MLSKIKQKLSLLFPCLLLLIVCSCKNTNTHSTLIGNTSIIPAPQEQQILEGNMLLDKTTTVYWEEAFETSGGFLLNYLQTGAAIGQKAKTSSDATISIIHDSSQNKEGYELTIDDHGVTIKAADPAGAFYGVQSLRQILPEELEIINSAGITDIKIPYMHIKDAPAFPYRGMHLDVSRHFYSKVFVKQYISHLASLKMNTFHWHLTDDQGWRIEIKQYPNLTKKGAYREETLIGHYNDTPQQFDGKRYGGFYTQEDVKEIVAFAAKHHVTVIPEIELPGHAQAAISAYPELGCTGEQVPVATKWGVFENIYCPKEETFTFLKNVLDEVMTLFPSEYIHIGGDEAPKTQWKACEHCQQLIKEKRLKDEHGLQSYFIKEIEQFVNSKGKRIIGWDEILEGGLAPNATVMSWRGTEGAVQAANEGHDVILTPTSHAYFDYYQATYEDEPTAIGGYLPLKKVYSFNPIPKALQGTENAKYVLGAQGNIWTEYMATEQQVEYMAFPRILAMSEVVWKGATENLKEDYAYFLERVEPYMERLDIKNTNYANHLFDLEGAVVKKENEVFYELTTPTKGKEIKYTINGGAEQLYSAPIKIEENTVIVGKVYKNGVAIGRKFVDTINYHKAINAQISVNVQPHAAYSAGGTKALINGVFGSNTRFGDKEWLGFWGDDLEITITFPEPTEVSSISTRFYNANGQWLYVPKELTAEGKNSTGSFKHKLEIDTIDNSTIDAYIILPDNVKDFYDTITLKIPSYGVIPDGLQGAGNKAWTFIDEIIVE